MSRLLICLAIVLTPPVAFGAESDAAASAAGRFAGSFRSGDHTLRIAEIPCAQEHCLYVELVVKGSELRPLRQQVWTLHDDVNGQLGATLFAFPEPVLDRFMPTVADTVVGMWAAPEHFPPIDLDVLQPLGRAVIESSGDGLILTHTEPLTLHRGDIRQMSLTVRTGDTLHWTDELRGRDGDVLDTLDLTLTPFESDTPVTITPEGLVMFDLRVGRGAALKAGDTALLDFAVYRPNGQLVDSTRLPNRKKELLQPAPGDLFVGFGQGVMGMRAPQAAAPENERHIRRLITPPVLAFGDRGRAPVVPPNETLIVTLELITLTPPPRN